MSLETLSLNSSTGVISGTPASRGIFNFTVQVSDNVASATKPLSITIMIQHGADWRLIGGIICCGRIDWWVYWFPS